MSSDAIALGTAGMLGFLHALEVDHLLAVSTFVSRRPTSRAAAHFGLRWGLGHSMAVLVAGGILLATGVRWPARYDAAGEGIVGLMLAALGCWALASARKLHLHPAEEHGGHAHLHAHRSHGSHDHPHERSSPAPHGHEHGGITLVGLLHGLAGTTGLIALVPVSLMDSVGLGLGYLTVFGIGVTVAMMLFALVAASAMRRAEAASLAWGRRAVGVVGVSGVIVGIWWLWRAMGLSP
jgi:hypothetical protein